MCCYNIFCRFSLVKTFLLFDPPFKKLKTRRAIYLENFVSQTTAAVTYFFWAQIRSTREVSSRCHHFNASPCPKGGGVVAPYKNLFYNDAFVVIGKHASLFWNSAGITWTNNFTPHPISSIFCFVPVLLAPCPLPEWSLCHFLSFDNRRHPERYRGIWPQNCKVSWVGRGRKFSIFFSREVGRRGGITYTSDPDIRDESLGGNVAGLATNTWKLKIAFYAQKIGCHFEAAINNRAVASLDNMLEDHAVLQR